MKRWSQAAVCLPVKLWSFISSTNRGSIRARFQVAVVVAFAGLVVVAGVAGISAQMLLKRFQDTAYEATHEILPTHRLEATVREAEKIAGLYLVSGNPALRDQYLEAAETVDRQFEALLPRFADQHQGERDLLDRARLDWQSADKVVRSALPGPAGDRKTLDAALRFSTTIATVYQDFSRLHEIAITEIEGHVAGAETATRWVGRLVLFVAASAFAFLLGLILVVRNSVLRPVEQLRYAAARLGSQDFAYRVKLSNPDDELGQLGSALNAAAESLQRLYSELAWRSTHDGLTGVLNRATFGKRLCEECQKSDRRNQPLSLLMVDIDFFKRVNDEYGHQAGDRVLEGVARALRNAVRSDDEVARYGGEEFAIILPETDQALAVTIAERVRSGIAEMIFERSLSRPFTVTASIGVACHRPKNFGWEHLLNAADAALYRAKETGRNRTMLADKRMRPPPRVSHRPAA